MAFALAESQPPTDEVLVYPHTYRKWASGWIYSTRIRLRILQVFREETPRRQAVGSCSEASASRDRPDAWRLSRQHAGAHRVLGRERESVSLSVLMRRARGTLQGRFEGLRVLVSQLVPSCVSTLVISWYDCVALMWDGTGKAT